MHFVLLYPQVSLHLESLTEAYNSSSSCPITDFSTEDLQVTSLTVPSEPGLLSAASEKESGGTTGNTPRSDAVSLQIDDMDLLQLTKSL